MSFFSRLFPPRKPKCQAFVLGGGGSRGAFQVGALQALLEAGYEPDMLVGTSIGAANATYIAINGFTSESLAHLREIWRDLIHANLLPPNYLWLTLRNLFGRPDINSAHRMQDFLISHGVRPDLRFADLEHVRLILVSSDLNSGQPVSHGINAQDLVLEGLLASTAVMPWVSPIHRGQQYLVDGGFLCNLPVEPALACGATRIVAINLFNPKEINPSVEGVGHFLEKLTASVQLRQGELELALSEARGIPTLHIQLDWPVAIPIWDFQYTQELIEAGYVETLKILKNIKPSRF